jgi:hypothetical protein
MMPDEDEVVTMLSPFPGINPFLEHKLFWSDFHQSFLKEIKTRLVKLVGPKYYVQLDNQIYLHELSAKERGFIGRSDLGLSTSQPATTGPLRGVIPAPLHVPVPAVDVEKIYFLVVRDLETQRLVTVVELLSHTNKYSGPDRDMYLGKRKNLISGSVNFVELDLLRGGPHMPIPGLPSCDYCILVRRAMDGPVAGLWPFSMRDPLPTIPIPLLSPDEDLSIDLQEIFHLVFDEGGYAPLLYEFPVQPALTPTDASWVQSLLSST